MVKSEKFSEIIQQAMNRYLNGMLTNEQVIEELLNLAKQIQAAQTVMLQCELWTDNNDTSGRAEAYAGRLGQYVRSSYGVGNEE